MKLFSKVLFSLALITVSGTVSEAKVELPALIGDGMVLQQKATVNIWGTAKAGKVVKVKTSWDSKTYKVKADDKGNWVVKASTGEAGGPYTISISDGEELVLKDILLGEVWLCSGQSNMEMPLMGFPSQPVEGSFEAIVEAGKYKNLRIFHVKRNPVEKSFNEYYDAKWDYCSSSTAAETSATGYFFASKLSEVLGVPVGLIEADWGGTRIEAWMSVEEAEKVNPDILKTDSYNNEPNKTAFLWKSMIEPLSRFTLRGFLWYQGESNNPNSFEYDRLMVNMVKLWRSAWDANGAAAPALNPALAGLEEGEQMPFLFAQVAPYDYCTNNNDDNTICAPLLWEAQLKALKAIPNSDIAVNMDLGSAFYIHPPHKKTLADRFLMLALHDAYGDKGATAHGNASEWRGPIFKSATFEGGKAIIEFEMNSTVSPTRPFGEEAPILGFEIAGEDRVFHPAQAVAVHDGYFFTKMVRVWSDEVPNPVAVRYAFKNLPGELNLANTCGLPAFPFRTDDWNDVY